MTEQEALEELVARWATRPNVAEVANDLVQHPEAGRLAVIWLDGQPEGPEELVDLLVDLFLDDPTTVEVRAYLDGVTQAPSLAEEWRGPLVSRVLVRPDTAAYQRVLADLLCFDVDDLDGEPSAQQQRRLMVGAALVDGLHREAFIEYLVMVAEAVHGQDRIRVVEQAWNTVDELQPDGAVSLVFELLALREPGVDVAPIYAEIATAAIDLFATHGSAEDQRELLPLAVEDAVTMLAVLEDDRAISVASRAFTRWPWLEVPHAEEEWFTGVISRLADQLETLPVSESAVRESVTELLSHRDRWSDTVYPRAFLALVMTRALLTVQRPDEAQEWLSVVDAEEPDADPDMRAEHALCQIDIALQTGGLHDLTATLRRAGPVVAQAGPSYRMRWQLTLNAVAQASQDATLTREAQKAAVAAMQEVGDEMLGAAPPDDQTLAAEHRATVAQAVAELDRHFEAMSRLTMMGSTSDDIELFRSKVPPPGAGTDLADVTLMTGLAVMLLARGDAAGARAYVARARSFYANRPDDVGVRGYRLMNEVVTLIIRLVDAGRTTPEVLAECLALRAECESAGIVHLSQTLTRSLVLHLSEVGRLDEALDEAIAALGFYVAEFPHLPDARERSARLAGLHAVANEAVRLAVAIGDRHTVAELLEVIRAHPMPRVAASEPGASLSLLDMVQDMLPRTGRNGSWSAPWSQMVPAATLSSADQSGSSQRHPPGQPSRNPGITELVLGGLPSIEMPWGRALKDRLRDPTVDDVVTVQVPRL